MPYRGSCLCKQVALQSAPLQEGHWVSHPQRHWDIYRALAAFLSGSLLLIHALEFLSPACKKDYKACTINLLVLIQWLSRAKPFYCYQYRVNTKQSQSRVIVWKNSWAMHNAEESRTGNVRAKPQKWLSLKKITGSLPVNQAEKCLRVLQVVWWAISNRGQCCTATLTSY